MNENEYGVERNTSGDYTCAECERKTTIIRNFHGLYLCLACFDYEKRGEAEIMTIIESKGFISATL